MTNHWDQHDHDPISHVTVVADRPTISLRHMSMSGGGFADRATGRKFHDIEQANMALIELALANDHAFGGVSIEPDSLSPVPGALHVVIHWGLVSDRYHLDTISYALPGEL